MNDVNESNISTNTLFHFTNSIDNLESILENEFYPRYCLEDVFGTLFNVSSGEKAIPMVCFCDIPLCQIKKHIKYYGDYAIGLSKKWAIKKKINPVIYTYPNSDFVNNIRASLGQLLAHELNGLDISTTQDLDELLKQKSAQLGFGDTKITNHFMVSLQYIKPYDGRLWKNGRFSKDKVRFYDEREWRYIPKIREGTPFWLRKGFINNPKIRRNINESLSSNVRRRLTFEPSDIKFIIVKKESEIKNMIDKVINIKKDKFTCTDVQILTTRIISMEQIRENF